MQLFLSAEPNTPRIAGVLKILRCARFSHFFRQIHRGSERNDRSTKRGQGTNHVWHIHIENEEKKKGRRFSNCTLQHMESIDRDSETPLESRMEERPQPGRADCEARTRGVDRHVDLGRNPIGCSSGRGMMQKTRNPNPKIQPDRAPAERSPSNKITLLSFRKRPSSAPSPRARPIPTGGPKPLNSDGETP